MGGAPDIERVSDADQFNETVQAMTVLGFSIQQIADIVKILAGILHLGNIEICKKYKEGSDEEDTESCEIYVSLVKHLEHIEYHIEFFIFTAQEHASAGYGRSVED